MDALKNKAQTLLSGNKSSTDSSTSGSSTTGTDASQQGYAAQGKELYSDYSTGNTSELQKDGLADAKAYYSKSQGQTGSTGTQSGGVGQGFADGNMGASGV